MTPIESLNAEGRARHRCEACGLTTAPILPTSAGKVRCRCMKPNPAPGIAQRAMNFMRDATLHVADGLAKVDDDERAARLAVCQACPLFDGTICTHPKCGCPMRKEASFIDALSWKSKKCPVGKW